MSHSKNLRVALLVLASVFALAVLSWAQNLKVQGLIKGRNGDTMILQTSDSPKLIVLLTDSTQVGQVQGVLKARRKQMSMAALIPGLAVQVEGSYNADNQLVATKVSFKGDDLEQAQSIQAGLHETQAQTAEEPARACAAECCIEGAERSLAAAAGPADGAAEEAC